MLRFTLPRRHIVSLPPLIRSEPLVKYTDVEQTYPHYPDFSSMRFSPAERAMFVDLRPYLSPTPSTIHVHTPVSAAFNAFKALALRHLVVVNDCHDCGKLCSQTSRATLSCILCLLRASALPRAVGIITRHDLLKSRLVELGSSMNRTFVAVSGVAAENVTDAAAPDVFASGQRSAGQSTDALH